MFASQGIRILPKYDWKSAAPVIRYALGSTLILAVAMGFGYTLSYVTPVLALGFLAPGTPPLSLKAGFGFVAVIAVASLIGIIFSRLFLGFPFVFIPLLALAMLHLYYTNSLAPLLRTWLIISLLLIPLISTFSHKLGGAVAINLVMNAVIAVVLVLFIYQVFPNRNMTGSTSAKTGVNTISDIQRFSSALNSIIVILPVVICYYMFQWSGSILVMVFVVLLSMNPETVSFKTGKFMIVANLAGGIAAIVAFNLFVVVPSFTFLILVSLVVGLYFGQKVFSGKPTAPLYGTGFSTFLLVLGSVTTAAEGDASAKVWSRIFQIGLAVTYVVVAFGLLNHFIQSKKQKQDV